MAQEPERPAAPQADRLELSEQRRGAPEPTVRIGPGVEGAPVRLDALVEQAAAIAGADRGAFLDRQCAGDLSLRRRVEARLDALAAEPTGDAPAPAPVVLPADLGPWEILGLLGAGGMGTVLRGRRRGSGELAAIKCVRAPRAELLASLRREIHALARLRHPGIVRILDHGLDSGMPWYAMELLEGTALMDLVVVATPRVATEAHVRRALTFTRAICAPLAYLHGEGMVHRDLKPANVLVQGDAAVLVDFGLASTYGAGGGRERLGQGERSMGTASYIAPEQVLGKMVDARADLYALGCILYELLTGRPPFRDPRSSEVVRMHLHAQVRPPSALVPGIPREVDELALRLLAKEPRRRVGHADDVAARLETLGAAPARAGLPPARAHLYQPEMVGRGSIVDRIDAKVAALGRSPGGALFLAAESGAGKTRILAECVAGARARGHAVLTGECPPRGAGALAGLVDPLLMLGDLCRERGAEECARVFGDHVHVLEGHVPGLGALVGIDPRELPAASSPEAARQRLWNAFGSVLAAYARPLVLAVDDLQWADDLTLGLLRHVLRSRGASPLLVLAAFRADEAGSDLQALAREPGAELLAFGGLPAGDVGSMVAGMLALEEAPERFGGFLAARSEGNPFFVAEYLRLAVDEGVLRRDEGGAWRMADVPLGAPGFEKLPLPASMKELLDRRLGGLADGARTVAELVAVVGREIDGEVLARMAAAEAPGALLDALAELVARQVIGESPAGYRFVHDRLREAAEGAMAPEKRARRHGVAAAAIEAIHGAPDHRAAELGRHWMEAGDRSRAAGCFLKASRHAVSRYALDEAEASYRRYLAIAAGMEAETVTARTELGHLLAQRGMAAAGEAELRRALDDARALGHGALEGEALLALAGALHTTGRVDEGVRCLDASIARARALSLPGLETRCVHRLAVVRQEQGRVEEAAGLLRVAARRAQEEGDVRRQRRCQSTLVVTLIERSRLEEARREVGDLLEWARGAGDLEMEASATHNLATIESYDGHPLDALRLYDEALAAARRAGAMSAELHYTLNLAGGQCIVGRLEEGRATYERAIVLARQLDDRRQLSFATSGLGNVLAMLGRRAEAWGHLQAGLAIAREIGDRNSQAIILENSAQVLREEGRIPEAGAMLEESCSIAREVAHRALEGWCLGGLGRLALFGGDVGRASELCAAGAGILSEVDARNELAYVACIAGHAELAAGRGCEAWLERARRVAAESCVEAGSDLAQAIGKLERALAAAARNERLVAGHQESDLTAAERAWIAGRR